MRCDGGAGIPTPVDVRGITAGVACPVDEARRVLWQAAAASCGREVYCREGTRQVATILTDITAGRGSTSDLDLVDELCTLMADLVPCRPAALAASSVLVLLREHADEWERHVRRGRCTSLTCPASVTLHVDPVRCTGCGDCREVCPVGAIDGGPGLIHVVDNDLCTRCGACLPACPAHAVTKAGPLRPRVPTAPVPVGSFVAAAATAGGMRRRRRPA